jgi:hypothetical protein
LRLHRGDQFVSSVLDFVAWRGGALRAPSCLPHVVCVRNFFVEYGTGSSTSDTLKITLF